MVGRKYVIWACAVGLFSVLAGELTLSVRRESSTLDEACHLYSGYRSLHNSDFGINPEHPPLVKMLAALGLTGLPVHSPPMRQDFFKSVCLFGGDDFLYSNNAEQFLFRARLMTASFTFLLAFFIFAAVSEVHCKEAALIALVFFVFEPNLLAHGVLVTTDVAITCLLFASVYAFWRYLRRPSISRLIQSGLAVGLTLAVKHSGLIILPTLALLAAVHFWHQSRKDRYAASGANAARPDFKRLFFRCATSLLAILFIGVVVLWSFYGFRFSARPPSVHVIPPLEAYAAGLKNQLAIKPVLWMFHWRLLPESYLYGLIDVATAREGRAMVLFGKWYQTGQWFYFPAVFIVKSTLALLFVLLPTLFILVARRHKLSPEILFLIVPPGLYFLFALTSKLDVGVRHILPVFPFLIVAAAMASWILAHRHRGLLAVIACLLAFHAASSLRAFPDYLAYSNEIWGGTAKTYQFLNDSNVDWGQGLKSAKTYVEQHELHDCWLAYYGTAAESQYYGVPCKRLPGFVGPLAQISHQPCDMIPQTFQGTLLVSVSAITGLLNGPPDFNPYHRLINIIPIDNIGGGILVFRGPMDLGRVAALCHDLRAWDLLASRDPDAARLEAEDATKMAPDDLTSHLALGDALGALQRREDARMEYKVAVKLAEPEHDLRYWIPLIEAKMRSLDQR